MMTFLLIYTHIGALVVGWACNDWWSLRSRFWADVFVLAFIAVAWPWVLYLMIRDARKGP